MPTKVRRGAAVVRYEQVVEAVQHALERTGPFAVRWGDDAGAPPLTTFAIDGVEVEIRRAIQSPSGDAGGPPL